MTYLLDANVFMSASRLHYGFDFCPAFWEWLVESNSAGLVFSIDKVQGEIQAGADELADWSDERGQEFFLRPDEEVLTTLTKVSAWCTGQQHEPAAINTFLSGADYYLVAHALAHENVVVTHEKPANSRKRIKIPNVCIALGITCMTPFEMLRRERARFVLQ